MLILLKKNFDLVISRNSVLPESVSSDESELVVGKLGGREEAFLI